MGSKTISDFTEKEFLDFVIGIYLDTYDTEQGHIDAVLEFERICEHPAGSDLIYYPDTGVDNTPSGIVKTIKEWRAANGKPGFKPE